MRLALAALTFLLIALLSAASGYRFTQPGYVVDFEIATLLTPVGLADHLLFRPDSMLTPLYFHRVEREFASWPLLLLITLTALTALAILRKGLKP